MRGTHWGKGTIGLQAAVPVTFNFNMPVLSKSLSVHLRKKEVAFETS